jgi:hypothetical protein
LPIWIVILSQIFSYESWTLPNSSLPHFHFVDTLLWIVQGCYIAECQWLKPTNLLSRQRSGGSHFKVSLSK